MQYPLCEKITPYYIVPEFVEDHLAIVQELTEALSLGYIRYLDFQRLEEKNKTLAEHLRRLRETQNQMILQEKMASLGDLVAGVAHEMNNPIGAVNSAADVSIRCLNRITEIGENIETVDELRNNKRFQKAIELLKKNQQVAITVSKRIDAIVVSLKNFTR